MQDYIVIAVIALVVLVAVLAVVRRARSKGGCCSGGDYVAKSRKLKSVAEKKVFRVEGMHCQNCVNRVMEDVQSLPHTSASVDLRKGTVTVCVEQPVEEAVLVAAIQKGGYRVI